MALKIVNTVPGDVTTPLRPDEPIQMGLRDTTGNVTLGSVGVRLAYSNLNFRGVLPEDDTDLAESGLVTSFRSVERRQPVSGAVVPVIFSGTLRLPKTDNSDFNNCVYELHIPITPGDSVMGYIKFRTRTAWTQFNPDWVNLTNMVGVYLGLEYGPANTALYTFLRNNGASGSLVSGGPLASFGGSRPGQSDDSFAWLSAPNDSVIELFIIFNTFTNPFQVEIWAKLPSNTVPVLIRSTGIGSIGAFPSSPSWPNSRSGPSDIATLFIGNSGRTGDLLQIDDFVLFPDFRQAISQGLPTARIDRFVLPDSPVTYRASSNLHPGESVPGRWIPILDPTPSLSYNPGQRSKAAFANIFKNGTVGFDGFRKNEPRLEPLVDGAMIEAFLSVDEIAAIGGAVGGGIGFEDGLKSYRLVAIKDINAGRQTFGIAKDDANPESFTLGYHTTLDDFDWTSLKLIRLVVDRYRDEIRAYCIDEDEPFIAIPISSSTIPLSAGTNGRMLVGNLIYPSTSTKTKLAELTYLNRYFAWEKEDLELPSDVGRPVAVRFTSLVNADATGSYAVDGVTGVLTIKKNAFNAVGSYRYYQEDAELTSRNAILVDFRSQVEFYTGPVGRIFERKVSTGAGLFIFMGSKKLVLTFVDAGIYGRKVGIIPGSGSVNDIIEQTQLGKTFSGSVDWTKMTSYRLVIRPYDSIQLWEGTVLSDPLISIPWRNETEGFDLPADVTSPSLNFGHYDAFTSSTTKWEHIRWGTSNGYDLAVRQQFQPIGKTVFGGKIFTMTDIT